jgi:hypothetical protein
MAMRQLAAKVPLNVGNWLAICLLALTAGFCLGWVFSGMKWAAYCFPPI